MSNEVVLDIETQNTFQDIGSRDTDQLKISVVGVYTYSDDQLRIYMQEELPKLWSILEHADRIIGYNHRSFDMPVLNNYYSGDCTTFPLLDMMEGAADALGYRPKLDDLAFGTLKTRKSGHGLDAVRYWQTGEIEKLKKYCLDDVRITRDLYEYGLKNRHIIYAQTFGAPRVIPVDYALPLVKQKINLTLGL
ncbi:MAG: ribonuclease H-like domain-containing protein [bacterium]|nr:ribonuclease H-like domain-containing protein [bacterium]